MVQQQFLVMPAYTFTNYQSQGQTLGHVIVNLVTPPSSALSLFNVYVTLSQSHRCENIHLLQDFDDNLFMKMFDADLIREDEQLEELDKGWERDGSHLHRACE
jgi:hypothetical protein